MSEAVEKKAAAYLASGRIDVREVDHEAGEALVWATGSRPDRPYHVHFSGIWTCDCPARVQTCAHIVAASAVVHVKAVVGTPKVLASTLDIDAFLASVGAQGTAGED